MDFPKKNGQAEFDPLRWPGKEYPAMSRHHESSTVSADGTFQSGHFVLEEWAAFRANHADWLQQFDCSKPIYCLPERFMTALTRARTSKPLFDLSAADAEGDFTRLC